MDHLPVGIGGGQDHLGEAAGEVAEAVWVLDPTRKPSSQARSSVQPQTRQADTFVGVAGR